MWTTVVGALENRRISIRIPSGVKWSIVCQHFEINEKRKTNDFSRRDTRSDDVSISFDRSKRQQTAISNLWRERNFSFIFVRRISYWEQNSRRLCRCQVDVYFHNLSHITLRYEREREKRTEVWYHSQMSYPDLNATRNREDASEASSVLKQISTDKMTSSILRWVSVQCCIWEVPTVYINLTRKKVTVRSIAAVVCPR